LHGLPADRLRNGKLFLRQAKAKHSVWVPLPSKVVKALKACDEGENGENRVARSVLVDELALTPAFDLLPHRLEVALHPAEPDVKGVGEDKGLWMFGEHGRVRVLDDVSESQHSLCLN
jgi:hypothetical protein